MSLPLTRWLDRVFGVVRRAKSLFLPRRLRVGRAPVVVVASCWHWPVYSHTFVYQEMLGLADMGLDVRLFHWAVNDDRQLQPAFRQLGDSRIMLDSDVKVGRQAKRHFDSTRPGRLRILLARVGAATGRTVEELEEDLHVLCACTFAREMERVGAIYVHTYFFYEQSFMAMVAAWLLDIPRGISCYSDHMLDDYPFKLVDLQIDLASVVVATSARIKQELLQLSGAAFDDRILVKPNGVDGARFPLVDRPCHAAAGTFEVVSVSRLSPTKGLTFLIGAVAELKRRGRRIRAHVVGTHDPYQTGGLEYRMLVERTIDELGVQDEVVLHGMKSQEEILPILRRSHAFAAPYVELATGDKDGIPTAILEAMAAGLPIVTTDSGSIPEVVADGVEGLVVRQGDSSALADALQRLADSALLQFRLGSAARARFELQFDARATERVLHQRVSQVLAGALGRSTT